MIVFQGRAGFYFGDQLNLCGSAKIPSGCLTVGCLAYQKRKTLIGLGFSALGTEGDTATAKVEGPPENLTKPSRHRAEKDDKIRELFGFFFYFCFYCILGGEVGGGVS